MTNKVDEHTEFNYFLTEIQLSTLIGTEFIPQESLSKIKGKSITHNIFRLQSDNSVICRFHWMAFIEKMTAWKTLLNYTNLFSPNDYQKNGKIIEDE